jgi:hypothetical protein
MAFEALSLEVEPPLLSVSTTALSSSCNPSTFGASVAFSATVSASAGVATTATGRITFYEGTTPVGTRLLSAGSASVSISTLSVGTHDVTAEYSGDDNFTASISSTITQIVSHSTSSTVLASSTNPSIAGRAVTLRATVRTTGSGKPSGTVTFYDGAKVLGRVKLSSKGTATLTTSSLPVGKDRITATYSGSSSYGSSTSAVLLQKVEEPTVTTVKSAKDPSVAGRAVSFTATVRTTGSGKPSGTVTFYDGTKVLGRVKLSSTGTATFTTSWLPVGKDRITARYSGSSSYGSSTSAVLVQKVKPS